jgi:hypothetical protein
MSGCSVLLFFQELSIRRSKSLCYSLPDLAGKPKIYKAYKQTQLTSFETFARALFHNAASGGIIHGLVTGDIAMVQAWSRIQLALIELTRSRTALEATN